MSRTVRYLIAVAAVVALVYTLVPALPSPSRLWSEPASAADAAICPANAKSANLNHTLNDLNGKPVSLAQFKGKVIILDFWATWCPPCKAEIPGFVELQKAYGGQGLAVIGVSVDDPPDKLKPFADEYKMNYPVLVGLGREDFQDEFGPFFGIPTTFVINRDGKICKKHFGLVGKARYEEAVKGLL
jgi:thiol-disulfide isomerase/thioredoxin